MSEDLKIQLAKEEYIKSLNEINEKYNLSFTIIEMILKEILQDVTMQKNNIIKNEYEKLKQEEKKKGDKNGNKN